VSVRTMKEMTEEFVTARPCRFIPTGIASLDGLAGGIPTGELTLVGARPSAGKTAICMQILENAAACGFNAGFFSLEMARRELLVRMVASRSSIPSMAIRKGELTADQVKIRDKILRTLDGLPLEIEADIEQTLTPILDQCGRWVEAGCHIIGLDFIQCLSAPQRTDVNRALFLGQCARAFKNVAKQHDVALLVLSQLNRLSVIGNRPPGLSDLRESGDLETAADNVILIHRDLQEAPNCDLILAKCRNGSIGTVSCVFDGARTRFEDMPR
jgi:replicative DNA helicase